MRLLSFIRPVLGMLLAVAAGMPAVALAQQKLKWAHVYEASEPYHTESVWAAEEIKNAARVNLIFKCFLLLAWAKKPT